MKAEELFKIVEDRGLRIKINDEGQPIVSGDTSVLTPVLIEALKAHRHEILAHLGLAIPKPPVGSTEQSLECLWPGNDFIGRHWFPENGWPAGAYFFRRAGQEEWLPIPGRKWDAETKRGTFESKPVRVDMESLAEHHG